jgi:hypothetical protein
MIEQMTLRRQWDDVDDDDNYDCNNNYSSDDHGNLDMRLL